MKTIGYIPKKPTDDKKNDTAKADNKPQNDKPAAAAKK